MAWHFRVDVLESTAKLHSPDVFLFDLRHPKAWGNPACPQLHACERLLRNSPKQLKLPVVQALTEKCSTFHGGLAIQGALGHLQG